MKNLYDKDARYTLQAELVEGEAYPTIRAIFDRWVKEGYSPRDISHILHGCVTECELMTVLDMNPVPALV